MSLIGHDPLYDAPLLVRKEFAYRGKKYVAIRHKGGRVELYRGAGSDGIETFLGYARRSAGKIDRIAISLVEDKLDTGALEARMYLTDESKSHAHELGGGRASYVSNVRLGPDKGRWGTVTYLRHFVGREKEHVVAGSVTYPFYTKIGEPVAAHHYRKRVGHEAVAHREAKREATAQRTGGPETFEAIATGHGRWTGASIKGLMATIDRERPAGSVTIRGEFTSDGTWHHGHGGRVVAVRDGRGWVVY